MERLFTDELNNTVRYSITNQSMRSLPYEEYFGEMELTEEQKKERIELAENFEKEFLIILSMIGIMSQFSENISWQQILVQIRNRYTNVLEGYIEIDDYVSDYIEQFSIEMVRTTRDNINDPYMLSYDRSRFISENESNQMYNHQDLVDAINAGKTKKMWVSMRDKRVRHTHALTDGQVVKITEPFVVGNSLLLVPKDTSYDADANEIVNCRCVARFY